MPATIAFGVEKVEVSDNGTTWTDLGATKGGVELTQDPDELEITSDQNSDPEAVIVKSARKTLTINLLNATPENLALAFGGTVSSDTVNIPALVTGIEKQIRITTKAVGGYKFVITIARGKISGRSSIRLTNEDAVTIPLEVKILTPQSGSPVTITRQSA